MYQVLARKYRPKNFHELLGQEHVSKALVNAINNERLHHAYLFTGTRGVGKTTIARILAKCLNCETGVTSEPCGVCSVCQSIDSGRFIDLIEIDAASRTKVEDTRELLDNVPYAPTQGRYKVYLIDEVHMLSTHSFNALLKTLEEPPEHVKFLLATTDPQKLPITIISRCLQFVLRPLPQVALAEYLGTILDKEQIGFETDALWQLSSSAKGSVRDALSLTDQAIAFGNGNITDGVIRQMLGLIDQADVIALLANIYQQNTEQLAQAMQLLREQVVDAKAVFDRLAEVLHQLAILQALPNFDLQINRQQTEQLQILAQQLPAELLQLYYEIVVKSRENLALANTPMQALEMCLLRLMAFKPLHRNQVVIANPPKSANRATMIAPEHSQTSAIGYDESNTTNSQPVADEPPTSSQQAELTQNQRLQQPPHNFQQADETSQVSHLAAPTSVQVEEKLSEENLVPENLVTEGLVKEDLVKEKLDGENLTLSPSPSDNTPPQDFEPVASDNLNPSDDPNETAFSPSNLAVLDIPQMLIAAEANASSVDEPAMNANTNDNISDAVASTSTLSDTAALANESLTAVAEASTDNINNNHNDLHHDHNHDNVSEVSPLTLLKPSQESLEGEWTPAKWDYWVFNAREQGWLDDDELVLAKRGVMTGEIHGMSQFVTEQSFLTHTATFDNFCQKLQQFFVGIDIRLAESVENLQQLDTLKPESRQQSREQQALQQATHQLEQQAVTQALLQQHATINSVKLIQ